MGHYRDQLGPLFEHVFNDAIAQVTAAEQELSAALRSALHRITTVDKRFDALRHRVETLHSQYEGSEDEDAPLYELWNEIEDGFGPPDLAELRAHFGEGMKQVRQLLRNLHRQKRDFLDAIRSIKE